MKQFVITYTTNSGEVNYPSNTFETLKGAQQFIEKCLPNILKNSEIYIYEIKEYSNKVIRKQVEYINNLD